MKITLIRQKFTENSTIGSLYIDGVFFCYTLEDKDRGLHQSEGDFNVRSKKVYGKTAIPYGSYEVAMTFSNKYQRVMPLLLNVPGFAGIRIHSGNRAEDSEGCILLGSTVALDFIGNSRITVAAFYKKLEQAIKKGKVFIEIVKAN